jgi:hypothetical protein
MKELTYSLCLITCVLTIVSVRAVAVAEMDKKRIDQITAHQNVIADRLLKMEGQICDLIEGSTWMFTVPCSRNCKAAGLSQ